MNTSKPIRAIGAKLLLRKVGGGEVYLKNLMNEATPQKCRILVVDDDLEMNTSYALLLEFDGHEVQTAYTAEAALAMLIKRPFELVITEYALLRMKGDEFAALIKHQWPGLPVIMVTTQISEFKPEDPPVPGVVCLLGKPFSMKQLRDAIHWAVSAHDSAQPPESPTSVEPDNYWGAPPPPPGSVRTPLA